MIAVNFLGVETELYNKIVGVQGFAHRVLQTTHDYIAAYYRYEIDPRGQIQFPFDNLTHEERLKNHWTKFLINEGERLAENDEIAIAILESEVMKIQNGVMLQRIDLNFFLFIFIAKIII